MGSINATVVAQKVSETIKRKKKVVMGEIIRDSGYSHSTSLRPTQITNSIAFNKALDVERKPLIERLDKEINAIELALSKKDKSKEEYRTLVGSLDIMIKNRQLLSGGATERQVFVLPSEVMKKNSIETTPDGDKTVDNVVTP